MNCGHEKRRPNSVLVTCCSTHRTHNSIYSNSMSELPKLVLETIEKTALFVRKNGEAFAAKLLDNNPEGKFDFLKESHPHHETYLLLLRLDKHTDDQRKGGEISQNLPIPKPLDFLFATDVPSISAKDLQIIKDTALYVAANTREHEDKLLRHMERKGKRSQFAFMKKSNTLHKMYQHYIDQYRILVEDVLGNTQSEHIRQLLNSSASDVFRRAYERAVYEKKNQVERKTQKAETREAELRFASIDWQDFALISRITFSAIDEVSEMSVPLLREDVMRRALETKSRALEIQKKAAPKEVPKTTESADAGAGPSGTTAFKGMKIRAAGEFRLNKKKAATKRTIQCPLTGQNIPEQDFDDHLRTLLRDPRYKEQQENYMKKNFTHASNLTSDQVYENIQRLVRKRDMAEEEESAAKRIDTGEAKTL